MTEEEARRFGGYIRELREDQGMGVRELARSTGLSPGIISMLEKGEVSHPKMETLKALTAALKTPLADMFLQVGYANPCGEPCIRAHLRMCYGHLSEEEIQAIEGFICQIENKEGKK